MLIQLGRIEGAAGGGGDEEAGGAGALLEATWAGGGAGALLEATWAGGAGALLEATWDGGGAGALVAGGATHFVQIVEVEVRTTVEIEVVTCWVGLPLDVTVFVTGQLVMVV